MEYINRVLKFQPVFKYYKERPLKFLLQNKDKKGILVFIFIFTIKDIWIAPASKALFKEN